MKFGKVADPSAIDFRLPADPMATAVNLMRLGDASRAFHVYLGCTGWSMKEWVGKVYPPGTKSKDYLKQYALQFNTIELNTTHYRIPSPELIDRWRDESTADFRFCPKVPQQISHSKDLGTTGDQIDFFCDAVLGLEDRLGCCFIQLPPYFGFDRIGLLRRFLECWPDAVPLAVELRHESWFETEDRQGKCFELLAEKGVSAVITDVAGRRDVLHMYVTTAATMVRFVGNGLHPSDYRRIDDWVRRLENWHEQGLHTAYFFTHEPDNVLAPELAAYMSEKLGGLGPVRSRGPKLFPTGSGRQMELFQ